MSFNLVRYSVTVDNFSFAVSLFLGNVGKPIIVKSVFWHFVTSCDLNYKSDIESPVSNLVISCVTIARSVNNAHGSPNPSL